MSTKQENLAVTLGYNANTSFVKTLKQEITPDPSDHESNGDEDFEVNDKFLEELEKENRMLEKELENLVTLKNQATLDSTSRTRSDDLYQTMDTKNLHKIDEDHNEEHESYCYSNSEDEHSGKKQRKKEKAKLATTDHLEFSPDIKIEDVVVPDPTEREHSPEKNFSMSPPAKGKMTRIKSIDDSISPDKIKTKMPQSARASTKDKENQVPLNNQSNSSSKAQRNNNSAVLKNSTNSSSKKTKASTSPPKTEKADKVTSLEYRLLGANKAIKSLENQIKLKDDKIQELLKEIDKKNKVIEMQKSTSLNSSISEKSVQNAQAKESLTTIMRKKEKQLEKKVKDQDVIISENKKYMIRLQDLNAKILQKIKEVEEENTALKKTEDPSERIRLLEEENKKLKERLVHTEGEREQIVNINEEYDKKYEKMVKIYTDVEEKSEKFIQKNKGLNDLLLTLITTYHNRDKLVGHS